MIRKSRPIVIPVIAVVSLLLVCAFGFAQSAAAKNDKEGGLAWTKGYTLFITDNKTNKEAHDLVDLIYERGGQVAIVVSPRVMLGWLPPGEDGAVIGKKGLKEVSRAPVHYKTADLNETESIEFFNKVASGAWASTKVDLANHGITPSYGPDALLPPASAVKTQVLPDGSVSPAPGNSDLMVGKVRMSIIFLESNGTLDPNRYTWTCEALNTMVSEINAGLSFWSSRAANYGAPLTFNVGFFRPTAKYASGAICVGDTRVLTRYEPIIRPANPGSSSGDALWINEVMGKFGFASGDKFARTNAFNAAQRNLYATNWATTSFVAYNPPPAPSTFPDGWFAYAYRSGHYSQLLYNNDGWGVSRYDLVHSHETGHLFGAQDQYASSGCNNCNSGDVYSKYVINGNCINCNSASVPSMMRNNEVALDGYLPGQLGWGLDINWARTTSSPSSTTAKTNWVPGQAYYMMFNMDVPGKSGQCVTVNSRWYRQFQGNLTQAESFSQPCLITTGGNRTIWLARTIPSAVFGEASWEVQVDLVYPNGFRYGRGEHHTAKGSFFVLPAAAKPISTSPVDDNTPPKAMSVGQ